jgi:ribosomal protein S18 acetylase RimI-like enzyme
MMTIREAVTKLDWERALTVLHAVYAGEAFATWERVQEMMTRARLEGQGAFLIAVDGHEHVLGATLLLAPGSGLHQVARAGEREFRMLAVAKEARNRGVGEALVQACIARSQAAQARGLVLWTQPSMTAAHRLYERLGFVRVPERDQHDPRGFIRLVYAVDFGIVASQDQGEHDR